MFFFISHKWMKGSAPVCLSTSVKSVFHLWSFSLLPFRSQTTWIPPTTFGQHRFSFSRSLTWNTVPPSRNSSFKTSLKSCLSLVYLWSLHGNTIIYLLFMYIVSCCLQERGRDIEVWVCEWGDVCVCVGAYIFVHAFVYLEFPQQEHITNVIIR